MMKPCVSRNKCDYIATCSRPLGIITSKLKGWCAHNNISYQGHDGLSKDNNVVADTPPPHPTTTLT